MELKLEDRTERGTVRKPLIVPYGIETYSFAHILIYVHPLIVPYGIET